MDANFSKYLGADVGLEHGLDQREAGGGELVAALHFGQ